MASTQTQNLVTPYIGTLLHDAARGQSSGSLALREGRYDIGDKRVTVRRDTRATLSPVYRNQDKRLLGMRLALQPWPHTRELGGLAKGAIGSARVSCDGVMSFDVRCGPAIMGQPFGVQFDDVDLRPTLQAIDAVFQDLASKIVVHPSLELAKLFALERSNVTMELPGGPRVPFDAEGRLPYSALRSINTQVRVVGETRDGDPAPSITLQLVHRCALERRDGGPERPLTIDLMARLGPVQRGFMHGSTQMPPPSDEGEARPEASSYYPYTQAIYHALLDTLPLNGTTVLPQRQDQRLADLLPDFAALMGEATVSWHHDANLSLRHNSAGLHIHSSEPVHVKLDPEHIPVRAGWLQRLIARLLTVSITDVLLRPGRAPGELLATGRVRQQFGWGPIQFSRMINMECPLTIPRDDYFAREFDQAVADIARLYTFSPLVRATDLVDLTHSNQRLFSNRKAITRVCPDTLLQADSTELYAGQQQGDNVVSLAHEAYLGSGSRRHPLHLHAKVSTPQVRSYGLTEADLGEATLRAKGPVGSYAILQGALD